jgi:hypothetical protein
MSSRNYTNLIQLTIDDFNIKLKDEMNKTDKKPNYNIKFKHGINKSYHKEFSPINFENQTVTFILFNKESDKTINLSFKFSISNSSSLKVLANLITVSLRENSSTNFKLISSSNSSIHNVFTTLNSLESSHSSFDSNIMNITIKIDYIQSFLQDCILIDYNSLYSDTKLKGITKNNLFLILQSNFKKYTSEDQLVYTLSIWLECEYNLQEKVENLIDLINWRKVSLDKIFEFVIKFSIILEKHNLSMFFTDIINEKINQAFDNKDSKLIGTMISEALFDSSNRVNFIQILHNMFLKDKLIANSTTNLTLNCNKSYINNHNESNCTPLMLKHFSDPTKEIQTLKLEEPLSDIKALPFLSSNISKISNNYAEEPFSERSLYSNKTNNIEEENGKSTLTKRNKINSFDTVSKKTVNKPSFYNSKPSPLNIEGNTNKKNLEKLVKKIKEKNAFSPLKICNCRKHKNENCCSPFKRYTVYINSNQSIQTSKTNSTEK